MNWMLRTSAPQQGVPPFGPTGVSPNLQPNLVGASPSQHLHLGGFAHLRYQWTVSTTRRMSGAQEWTWRGMWKRLPGCYCFHWRHCQVLGLILANRQKNAVGLVHQIYHPQKHSQFDAQKDPCFQFLVLGGCTKNKEHGAKIM